MKISVILAHPYDKSFNCAIAKTACEALFKNGHKVLFHDLYKEKFNPIITADELISDKNSDDLVSVHQRELKEADGIIIIHPNWWGQPPAIMKGWIDRIMRENIAYSFAETDNGEGIPKGLLKAKTAIVFNTSNTPPERENTVFGDPLETLWKNCIFDFCGIKKFERKIFRVVVSSSPQKRAQWLNEIKSTIDSHFPPKQNLRR